MHRYLKNLNKIKISDLNSVGGKNASLGEMMNGLNKLDIKYPQGYALTTEAYSDFIKEKITHPAIHRSFSFSLVDTHMYAKCASAHFDGSSDQLSEISL